MSKETSKTAQYSEASLSKGERSRTGMVNVARRLIALNGYQSTSLQKVADAVGVSQSAVMHHYPTKLALFRGVLESMVAENAGIAAGFVDPKDDAMKLFMKFFATNFTWAVERDFNAQIMTCLFHFASFDEEFRQMYSRIQAGAVSKILAILHAGEREKAFKLTKRPELIAEMLHDGLFGSILAAVTTEARRDSRAVMLEKWAFLIESLTGAS
jgi:AcrR family transcriptional regulator